MYYDDNFHPTNDEDNYSVMDESIATHDSKTNSVRNRQKKIADDVKRADKGYCFYQIKPSSLTGFKSTKIEFFNSGSCIGNRIRDPISGTRMIERVGTKDEYKFFKVSVSGINSISGVKLFYDSPEQYERHHKCVLNTAIKEKWHQERFSAGNQ